IVTRAGLTIRRTKSGKAPKSLMLLGLRGVGKTVLLNEFEQIAERLECQTVLFEVDGDRSLAEQLTPQLHQILLKLSRIAHAGHSVKRALGLLQGFASAFKVKYGDAEFGVAEPVTGDLVLDLMEIFVAVGQAAAVRKTAVVILVDEVHVLNKVDLGALIMALHRISQRQLPVLLFGAGLPQLAKLAGDAKSYAERLFDYPSVTRLDEKNAKKALTEPVKALKVKYNQDALKHIIEATGGYPFFLQLWGSEAWDVAPKSPIRLADAKAATKRAIRILDEGTFNLRYERLTARQRQYARALAETGPEPARSGEVAALLGMTVNEAAPVRDELIKKGMMYSPERGLVAFTMPLFDDFLRRKMPGFKAKKVRRKKTAVRSGSQRT
ncbi:MAG: ATP-binding protein, partial [Hyphomicrobiaceae bacterium]